MRPVPLGETHLGCRALRLHVSVFHCAAGSDGNVAVHARPVLRYLLKALLQLRLLLPRWMPLATALTPALAAALALALGLGGLGLCLLVLQPA